MRYLIPLLAVLALSGCTNTEYIHVTPECTPPPSPVLPELSKGELWDSLEDDHYRDVELYINTLWGYSDEQSAMLDTLCNSTAEK